MAKAKAEKALDEITKTQVAAKPAAPSDKDVESAKRVLVAAGQQGFIEAAAAAVSNPAPGDPPSEAEVGMDFDFVSGDMLDAEAHMKAAGKTMDPAFEYMWIPLDRRSRPRYTFIGWEPTGVIFMDIEVARMPKAKCAAYKKRRQDELAKRQRAPMKKFDRDVSNLTEGLPRGAITTFDGDASPGEGM